jgi:hypothetical protein
MVHKNRGITVGIATGYGLDYRGVAVPVTSPYRPHGLWGPPDLLSNRYLGALSLKIKQPVREPDNSTPTSDEVKKICIYTFTPPIRLHGALFNWLRTGTTLPFT